MIKQTLLNEFKKSTSVKNDKDGERILKNDLISDFSYENNDETIALISSVISENLFSEYSCKLKKYYLLIVAVMILKKKVLRKKIIVASI